MPNAVKTETRPGNTDVAVAEHAERQQAQNQPDPFPEEGTDDKTVQGPERGDGALSEGEAVRATKAVIAAGLSGGGKTSADWPDGQPAEALDDGTNKPDSSGKPQPGL
jgi:hypothetical protein